MGSPDATLNEQKAYSIKAFCKAYSVGKTMAYSEIKAGRLKARKVRSRTLIQTESAQDWADRLPTR